MSNAIKAILQGQNIITYSYSLCVFSNFVLLVMNSEQSNIQELSVKDQRER